MLTWYMTVKKALSTVSSVLKYHESKVISYLSIPNAIACQHSIHTVELGHLHMILGRITSSLVLPSTCAKRTAAYKQYRGR